MKGPGEHVSVQNATLLLSTVKTSTLIYTAIVGLLVLLSRYLQIKHDPREPSVIPKESHILVNSLDSLGMVCDTIRSSG